MGIWIDPAGEFADEAFVNQARSIVTDVLSYSKNYNHIIAYIIMNEPQPETIAGAGYDETVSLWRQLTDIIHEQHPNRPVTIANTCNGTYINPAVFDFSAYNVYIYNPVTVNYLLGYREFTRYLNQLNHTGAPLIITEYGLSVSPSGPGNWGYGGNSLIQQTEGDLYMYKALADGGAAGSCVFNYSDGWWKGGNEFVHDDKAEEWFGLVNYRGLQDKYGEVRPAWEAVKKFQSAIITQPRTSEIYPARVPVEIFINDTVDRIEIMLGDQRVYQRQGVTGYLLDTLFFDVQGMKDAVLVFNCYDAGNNLVKQEEKSILMVTEELVLPAIRITIANPDFWQNGYVNVDYQINKSPVFNSGSRLDYIFYPHVGFDYGFPFQLTLPAGDQMNFTSHHALAANVNVFTVGAAFDVTFGSFSKRIVNQMTLSRINEIENSADGSSPVTSSIRIYPDPTREYFTVTFPETMASTWFTYTILNNLGVAVQHGEKVGRDQPVDVKTFQPGIYYIRLVPAGEHLAVTRKIIKL
ncbi:MAG: T9SS type A sorting domain-containing protein [Bacteroidota bacterium]